jgi:hypothetical protein
MPKFDRRAIMARAWEIFRETYKYPAIKFASIGRAGLKLARPVAL